MRRLFHYSPAADPRDAASRPPRNHGQEQCSDLHPVHSQRQAVYGPPYQHTKQPQQRMHGGQNNWKVQHNLQKGWPPRRHRIQTRYQQNIFPKPAHPFAAKWHPGTGAAMMASHQLSKQSPNTADPLANELGSTRALDWSVTACCRQKSSWPRSTRRGVPTLA